MSNDWDEDTPAAAKVYYTLAKVGAGVKGYFIETPPDPRIAARKFERDADRAEYRATLRTKKLQAEEKKLRQNVRRQVQAGQKNAAINSAKAVGNNLATQQRVGAAAYNVGTQRNDITVLDADREAADLLSKQTDVMKAVVKTSMNPAQISKLARNQSMMRASNQMCREMYDDALDEMFGDNETEETENYSALFVEQLLEETSLSLAEELPSVNQRAPRRMVDVSVIGGNRRNP